MAATRVRGLNGAAMAESGGGRAGPARPADPPHDWCASDADQADLGRRERLFYLPRPMRVIDEAVARRYA